MTGQITYTNATASSPFSSIYSTPFHLPALAYYPGPIDIHSPFLTVRETLLFAGACLFSGLHVARLPPSYLGTCSYLFSSSRSPSLLSHLPFASPSLRAKDLSSSQLRNFVHPSFRQNFVTHRADLILSLLSLTSCQHALVGDISRQGISTGERRRLSLGETLMGNYSITCFDKVRRTSY